MRIDFCKTVHIFFFVVLLPALSIVLVYIMNLFLEPFKSSWYFSFIDSLGGIGAYAFLYIQFDRYAWKWQVFRLCRLIDFPDLSGRWKGEIVSSYDKRTNSIPAVLEIRQTFSKICLDLYTEKSSSVSILSDFVKEQNGQLAVHHEYQNAPNEKAESTMHAHYGTARVVYFKDDNSLRGSYYNAGQHDRGHVGSLTFSFDSEKLLGRFNK